MIPASLNTKEENPLDVLKFYAIEKESISYSSGNDLIMDIMWRLAVAKGLESERLINKLKDILYLNDKKMTKEEAINFLIRECGINSKKISDEYHSFEELYEFRKAYNAVLFNEWATQNKYDVHKSTRHADGEQCFGGGWFIVVAILPTGQISNHYKIADWDLFKIPSYNTAKYKYDGHAAKDVLDRLKSL